MTLAHWDDAWSALGLSPAPELNAELRRRWSEGHRAYHTLHHLQECLHLLDNVRELARRPAEIEIALWFHDAIYEPRRSDNELRSADWARGSVERHGGTVVLGERLHELVMVTRHDGQALDDDARLLSDIDLSILGAGPARFDEYEKQVRREYRHVPTLLYRPARRKILRDFLARPQIYQTPHFRQTREATARSNLERSIKRLGWW